MPRPQDTGPTYPEIIKKLLDSANGPILAKEFTEAVLALRPSTAKNPKQAIKTQLRQETGHLLVYLDQDTILPTHLAMNGVRFRIQLDRHAIDTGLVEIGNCLASYLPRRSSVQNICFIDAESQLLDFQLSSDTKKETDPFFGTYNSTNTYANLGNWLRKHKAIQKDYILFTLVDWQNGIFQIEHEKYAKRDAALLKQRNQLLADLFYEMLESSTHEDLYQHEAVPTIYARFPDKSGYPPDHWLTVLENDKRMVADNWAIRYSDGQLPPIMELERELAGESREIQTVPFSKEQGKQVFRFKAEFKDTPKIWREVEILGKQTLADLTSILVSAFNHDWDHMAGFWKLVPRKSSSGKVRYREVDLGDVNPLEEGDGAEIKIAEIGLSIGEKLKFVFDFGDWIEHILTLEAVATLQSGVKYPRETARNKPKYVYCIDCEQEGKQTVAEWICFICSNENQKEMVYCEKCSGNHEDHYLEEITY
jgi:hypothetical protein